jgi:hypothetical protein
LAQGLLSSEMPDGLPSSSARQQRGADREPAHGATRRALVQRRSECRSARRGATRQRARSVRKTSIPAARVKVSVVFNKN